MKYFNSIHLIVFLISLFSCQTRGPETEKSNENKENPNSVNPVLAGDRPDPTVIQIGEFYYASATSNEWAPLFPIFRSSDLVNWELVNYVFPDGAPDWARNNFWAPELSYDENQDKIYAYYTARDKESNRLSVAVASSASPLGEFEDHGPLVAQEAGSIDAFETRDENGKLYLSWKEDGNSRGQPTPLWIQEINEDRTSLVGEPKELFRNDQPWEKHLIEGISIFRENGYFYATYSAGSCCDKACDYVTGVARSKTLLGEWEKYDQNPVLRDNDDWKCPGHGTVIKRGGDYYMLYHAYHRDGSVFVGREGVLEKIHWTDDKWPVFENTAVYNRGKPSLDFDDDFKAGLDPVWQWRVTQDIEYKSGDDGLFLAASLENENLGTLLVQGSKSTDYIMEAVIGNGTGSGEAGIAILGAAHNGFGAPVAGMGVSLRGSRLILWENKEQEARVLDERSIQSAHPETSIRLKVTEGHLVQGYFLEKEEWLPIGDQQDVSHLVPWGMGFRLGLVARGAPEEWVNFKKVSITYP